jgi:transposase
MKKLTPVDFGRILILNEEGFSIRKIEEKTSVPRSTIAHFLKRTRERGYMERKVGSGRHSLLGDAKLKVLREIHKNNRKISAPKLNKIFSEKTNITVSTQTIRNSLNKLGIFASRSIQKPLLSKKNILSRFDICTRWSYRPETFWETVIFSDECKFNLFTSDGIQYVWREPGKRLDSRYLSSTIKHGGGNIMTWGCISSKGVGRLVFIERKMDKYEYVNILSNNLRESASEMGLEDFVFQHDNDPKHSSKHVKGFLEESRIKVLEWPSQSPDLNPIEHIWSHMKRKLAGKLFKNKTELKEELTRLWNGISMKIAKNLVRSMPRRIRQVLKANGGHINY